MINNIQYHWNGLDKMDYIKSLDVFDRLKLFMHITIERDIMLKHTAECWRNYKLPEFSGFTDEQLCHHGVNLKLI